VTALSAISLFLREAKKGMPLLSLILLASLRRALAQAPPRIAGDSLLMNLFTVLFQIIFLYIGSDNQKCI